MKYKIIGVIVLLIGVISSCKKDNPVYTTPAEPSISSLFMHFFRHNATDSIATLPHGISVHLYFSSSDQMNHTNQIGNTLTPDSFGQIYLPAPVQKRTYYWWAEMGAACVENYGSVNASINITHSAYAELKSPDTLVMSINDTCTTCNTYRVYMKSLSDYLATNYVQVSQIVWNSGRDSTYRDDIIPNLPIGTDSVRIMRDQTLRAAGLLSPKPDSANDDSVNYGLQFSTQQSFVLHSIDIYNGSKTGKIILELQDNLGDTIPVQSKQKNHYTATLTAANALNTIVLDWNVPVMTNMRLVRVGGITSGAADSLICTKDSLQTARAINFSGTVFGSITNGYNNGTTNTDYNLAYNWQIIFHPAIDTSFAVNINCNQATKQVFPH